MGIKLRDMEVLIAGIKLEDFKGTIIDMYTNQNKSMKKIGEYYGVSKTTIRRYLVKWNIKINTQSEHFNNKRKLQIKLSR